MKALGLLAIAVGLAVPGCASHSAAWEAGYRISTSHPYLAQHVGDWCSIGAAAWGYRTGDRTAESRQQYIAGCEAGSKG